MKILQYGFTTRNKFNLFSFVIITIYTGYTELYKTVQAFSCLEEFLSLI